MSRYLTAFFTTTTLLAATASAGGAQRAASAEVIDVAVGSAILDASHAADHVALAKIFRVAGSSITLLDSARWTFTAGDSGGTPVRRVRSDGGSGPTLDVTLDRRSLALYGLRLQSAGASNGPRGTLTGNGGMIAGELSLGAPQPMQVHLAEAAFLGNLADLFVEAVPRTIGVAYRANMWQLGAPKAVVHLYQTTGHEDITVLGQSYPQSWVVEDRSADAAKLLSRMWLIDSPPYIVRWDLLDATADGSIIRVEQELARGAPESGETRS